MKNNRDEAYKGVISRLEALLEGEDDIVARMAEIASELHFTMGFWWTGFYRVQGGELVLGPFQGPMACLRIAKGRGVCGTAWAQDRTIIVPDVEKFPGHIACSSESRSEIVVPVRRDGEFVAELDIDSRELANFDENDAKWLELIVEKFCLY